MVRKRHSPFSKSILAITWFNVISKIIIGRVFSLYSWCILQGLFPVQSVWYGLHGHSPVQSVYSTGIFPVQSVYATESFPVQSVYSTESFSCAVRLFFRVFPMCSRCILQAQQFGLSKNLLRLSEKCVLEIKSNELILNLCLELFCKTAVIRFNATGVQLILLLS